MCWFWRASGTQYVVLDIAKSNEAERDEAEYYGAYLLLMENVRMQLTLSTLRPLRMGERGFRPRVVSRVRYTTESLMPHRIESLDEFRRQTPHQQGWLVENRLAVHPEDIDKAVHILGRSGISVRIQGTT